MRMRIHALTFIFALLISTTSAYGQGTFQLIAGHVETEQGIISAAVFRHMFTKGHIIIDTPDFMVQVSPVCLQTASIVVNGVVVAHVAITAGAMEIIRDPLNQLNPTDFLVLYAKQGLAGHPDGAEFEFASRTSPQASCLQSPRDTAFDVVNGQLRVVPHGGP